MASSNRYSKVSIKSALFSGPENFEFFQSVRLLECIYVQNSSLLNNENGGSVGCDNLPINEAVRFTVTQSFSFPSTEISSLSYSGDEKSAYSPPKMQVTFMGLTGPSGVLPNHYTDFLIQRMREKDYASRDFFDLFNHRSISLFYRAWEKYRFPIPFEKARRNVDKNDSFTQCLYALVGLKTNYLRDRLGIADETLLHYSGYFSNGLRSASALQSMLIEYFKLPLSVEEYSGKWLSIDEEDQTRLPGEFCDQGIYTELGLNTIIGEKVWSIENKFRIKFDALDYEEFEQLLPVGNITKPLCKLIRSFIRTELSFDLQPVLKAEHVPLCGLGTSGNPASQLGWNTWLFHSGRISDADDAVFMEV